LGAKLDWTLQDAEANYYSPKQSSFFNHLINLFIEFFESSGTYSTGRQRIAIIKLNIIFGFC